MDDQRRQLLEVIRALQELHVSATGTEHPWLTTLSDPSSWEEPRTLNWLRSTASGSLGDRYFTSANGDTEPPSGFEAVNRRWQALFADAGRLAHELELPAGDGRHR